ARRLFHVPIDVQSQKLMAQIHKTVEMLDRFDEVKPELAEMGRKHAQYGVQAEHYETVKAALMWAMSQVLESRFDRETRAAWNALVTQVCEAMIGGART